jgi:hypothetical protein
MSFASRPADVANSAAVSNYRAAAAEAEVSQPAVGDGGPVGKPLPTAFDAFQVFRAVASDSNGGLIFGDNNTPPAKGDPSPVPPLRTIRTGDGNDVVQIDTGDDHLVHVKVNGKEAWAGTREEFDKVQIDTGRGDDLVINHVDGARINTGDGDDVVVNDASKTIIDTGYGKDIVQSHGNHNFINAGGDDNQVYSQGSHNSIVTGAGNDVVDSRGSHNTILTQGGADVVITKGNDNNVNTGSGDDAVVSRGNGNRIDGDFGNDAIVSTGDRNVIDAGPGLDTVYSLGKDNDVKPPRTFPHRR